MAQIAYVDWDGLVYYDGKIKDYISNNLEDTLKDGGQVLYGQLPTPTRNNVNFVFTVMEDFTRTEELFGVNGGTYNKGTALKVTEVNPGQYLYTIVNETRNPNDVETFDDIYEQIKELKDAIDAFNPESSDYYNKSEINERFAKTHLELDRQDKRIDKLAANVDEDHRVLCELISGGMDVDLSNYYTKEESDSKFATFEDLVAKADNVLFTDSEYKVTKAAGDFEVGNIIKNISITDLFTGILGLQKYIPPVTPDDPESVITEIITQNIPLVSGTSSDALEGEYSDHVFETNAEYAAAPVNKETGTSIFYQKLGVSGVVEEYGYQSYTPTTGRGSKLIVAIPEGLVISKVTIWDGLSNSWTLYRQTFNEVETIENNGVKYTVYECTENGKGATLRIIVEEK